MKTLYYFTLLCIGTLTVQAQEKKDTLKPQLVEVSCGQCQFGMKNKKGCDLAVRIDGSTYFVSGTGLNDHGDAHSEDGFCSTIRKAQVVGEVKDNLFVVTSFQLVPLKP